jgi:hypothetical protein
VLLKQDSPFLGETGPSLIAIEIASDADEILLSEIRTLIEEHHHHFKPPLAAKARGRVEATFTLTACDSEMGSATSIRVAMKGQRFSANYQNR